MYYLEAALYCSIDFWTCKKRFLSTIQLFKCGGPKIKPWYAPIDHFRTVDTI